jgi:NADPH:quinone reductase-like Zn-dependent oxidoreductase
VTVPAPFLAPKPRTLGYIECAAIPLAALSAWQGLFDRGDLQKGQRVLIHGAAGGVGSYAVQLAHQHGAYVIGTASTKSIQTVRDLGADQVVDHTKDRFEDAVGPVDLVFDTVGGDRLRRSPAVLRAGGKLVTLAEEPPPEVATAKGISAVYFLVKPNRDQLVRLAQLVDSGVLRSTIDKVFPFADARRAFQRSLDEHGPGKIVLCVVEDQRTGEH